MTCYVLFSQNRTQTANKSLVSCGNELFIIVWFGAMSSSDLNGTTKFDSYLHKKINQNPVSLGLS